MDKRTILAATGALTSAALIGGLATAPTASAIPTGRICEPGQYAKILSHHSREMRFTGVPQFRDGPGGELEVSRSYSGKVGFSVTVGAEAEAGVVLAKAKTSISASLTLENTTTTTHTYRHKISRRKYGHAKYVTVGQRVSYNLMYMRRSCQPQFLHYGVINLPTREEGWKYWETSY